MYSIDVVEGQQPAEHSWQELLGRASKRAATGAYVGLTRAGNDDLAAGQEGWRSSAANDDWRGVKARPTHCALRSMEMEPRKRPERPAADCTV